MDNLEILNELIKNGSPIVMIVMGIVQAFKVGGVSSKYAPLLSIVIGASIVMALSGMSITTAVAGMAIGLMASGLWSGVKTVVK